MPEDSGECDPDIPWFDMLSQMCEIDQIVTDGAPDCDKSVCDEIPGISDKNKQRARRDDSDYDPADGYELEILYPLIEPADADCREDYRKAEYIKQLCFMMDTRNVFGKCPHHDIADKAEHRAQDEDFDCRRVSLLSVVLVACDFLDRIHRNPYAGQKDDIVDDRHLEIDDADTLRQKDSRSVGKRYQWKQNACDRIDSVE